MRSLTRPAYRDVAYGYDGQAESLASLDAYIEEPVAEGGLPYRIASSAG